MVLFLFKCSLVSRKLPIKNVNNLYVEADFAVPNSFQSSFFSAPTAFCASPW